MRDTSQLEMVRKYGQIIFTWTDEKNDKDTVKALKQLGVNGVIYDRMDWNNDKLVKESIFMTKERTGDSLSSGVSSAGSDYSPVSSPGRSPRRKEESLNFEGRIILPKQ